ncbi:DUF567 domain containing protein [Niveomyces insectorum RCEF 264]|uniref:DUF567 domain containing protein n=1 Tax=Niveomyces insectorum RCEF 264 TaxID=1081102 RepID=A0A167NGY9_9HYPO|nr:DUF567 domain containing protein [Niveomyces insectorum RCEF 264]
MASQLPPLPQQIGIFDQFVARQTETLILKEKILSLSGDSYEIRLANGQPLLNVVGKVLTIKGRKSVYDMGGRHLFDIRQELLHLHPTYVLVDPQGNKIFTLRNRILVLGTRATAMFTTPATGKMESLTMRGDFFDLAATIVDDSNGSVVARIDRKLLNARQLAFDQSSYAVVVAPGADMAIVAALCICLDDKETGA